MKIISLASEDVDENDQIEYSEQRTHSIELKSDILTSKQYLMQAGINEIGKTHIYLGPNEVFFVDRKKLNCKQDGTSTDPLNQNKYYSYITNFKEINDGLYWGVHTSTRCSAILNCKMDIKMGNENAKFLLVVDRKVSKELTINNDQNDEDYTWTCKIRGLEKGFHSIELYASHIPNKSIGLGNLHYLKLSCKPNGHIIRERWRPNAAHCNFFSSETANTDAWTMSIKKELPTLQSYNPLTTPFGYFGSGTDGEGCAGNINFSLWSYGKNDPIPETYKLSRILAIGHPTAEFSHFSHEGTGVKIRNFDNVWDSNTSKEYVFGLRMVHDSQTYNDGQLNIFYSYYWDEGKEEWKIYGVAKKFNKNKDLDTLKVGAFVEVTGASSNERSCQVERKIFYRGYFRDTTSQEWRLIDELKPLLNGDTIKNKSWGQEDYSFYVSTGGLVQNDLSGYTGKIKLSTEDEGSEPQQPKYMDKIYQINNNLPFPIITSHEISESQFVLNIDIPDKNNNNNQIIVYYGNEDGLTIDRMWEHKVTFNKKTNRVHELKIDIVEPPKYCRILVRDDELQIFNLNTYKLN